MMKKYFNFAFLSAIALVGTLGFTACSSTDDTVAEESKTPGDVGAKGEVTTQFVFNVSNGSSSTTRMSGAATQASTDLAANDFRGIENCFIMCFNQTNDNQYLATTATADKSFDMSRVIAAKSLDSDHSRRVLEMSLPLNTNTMLFYGKAINDNTVVDYKSKFGYLDNYNVTNDLSTTYFQLGRRLTATDKGKFLAVQKLLAAVLSCIINTNRGTAAVAADDVPDTGIPAYGFALEADYMPSMLWSAYNTVDADGNPLSPANTTPTAARPLEIKLFKVYKEMTSIQDAELRNASGVALLRTTKDLWTIVNSVRCATPTNKEEALAKYMAHLIDLELRKYFTATVPTNGGAVDGVAIKAASDLISELATDAYWPTTTAGAKPDGATFSHITAYVSDDFAQFPSQFALPQGATHIKFDDTKKTFYYVENYNTSAVGGTTFTVDDYYYPAELCYFGNSPIRVSDAEHVVAQYPENVTSWNTEGIWSSDWALGHVQSTTRSVAMKNDINYGTALLETTVGYNTLTLKDNNKAIQQRDYGVTTEEDKEIYIYDNSFKLVSIIIGDQWPKVGWNFLPITTGDANYRKGYIYDNQITNNGIIPASTSTTSQSNYTLVFDNYQDMRSTDATNKQSKVYVALELQNNTGRDFFGKDNLITNGSNFYLIGELDPSTKTGPVLPTYHALPPYDATAYGDATKTVPRVFIQDHVTKANFKIGVNALKNAYLTVPDLRSSSVTLGLSVDVKWETGLDFNVVIGGN